MHSSRISFHTQSNLSKCYLLPYLINGAPYSSLMSSFSLSLSFVCVYACVFSCVSVHTCAHTYMCMWKQEVNVDCLLHLLNTFSSEASPVSAS
ncbi:hypothetical protein ACRRTK_015446 [Alexandromys fortis]